jgi:site-specific recombinase XerC
MPVGDFPPEPLQAHEALALVRAPNPECRTGCRDRALLAVMWRCGLRNSEARNLELSHVIVDPKHAVRVLRPKGARSKKGKAPRTVGVDDQTWALLESWIAMRGDEPGILFSTASGKPINDRDLRTMVAYNARRAGIRRRVHPHALRHTFAKGLYDESVGMVHIQELLGHTQLTTTAGYLQGIGATEVVEISSARKWEI